MTKEFDISAFDYHLPRELIAQEAVEPRDSSRLLRLDRATGEIRSAMFRELPAILRDDDLLVVNDTRVFPARLLGTKPTGGKAEIFLLERMPDGNWSALIKPARRLKPGTIVEISEELTAEILEPLPDSTRKVKIHHEGDIWTALERYGHTPLPLYIDREDRPDEAERYQTIYARNRGAVAAPTAGLHFTDRVMNEIRERGIEVANVTLHVGWGTFSSIEAEDIREHSMHAEYYEIPPETATAINSAIESKRRIVAVGTTTVRALESSAARGLPVRLHSDRTELFIYPGFDFKLVSAIITNFHLPKSSLIVMISAFAGRDNVMRAYEHAVAERYRFYSYGDAMLVE
ncbi:MAG TPA: tRNA preQ1(34) S-adenosylmethionine ribosyltransferase-isomerase QueA [candidate division Zixibacteria bacterium]|nr:tRNA preQ1(34) S-adenosylmethionine ribosyltransferase-isomerase QueA [candidate division Zixibacteria bacterium]